jgi:dihydrofolate synthase / folylpolyglutamate synthase
MPQNLADWLSYLESLHPKTIALGLERVEQIKQRLGLNPSFPVIVVGGTNGKGSVCAMLEAIFHAAGYRVGCYTSPHLLDYNERVRIEKCQANDAELCAAFEKIEQVRGNIPLTYFEFGTLAAMQCFIARGVEVAILEVGLGGRLDAVNVFDNDCAVITSVDIDHTDYLGDTREQIAFEKAGIFRRDRVAIFGDLDMPATITGQARQTGAKLWRLGQEFDFTLGAEAKPPLSPLYQGENIRTVREPSRSPPQKGGLGQVSTQWDFRGPVSARSALPLPALRGAFQLNNASAALAALDALKEKLPVNMESVRRGLVEVALPGRFQVLPGKPVVILDVAHNPHAARSLAQNLADMPLCS